MIKDVHRVLPNYKQLLANLSRIKSHSPAPLTLSEKIIYSHISQSNDIPTIVKGETYLKLKPDRVAMQDASAQMALLQFMLCGRESSAVPASIHCDHLIRAYEGADKDVASSLVTEKEIYDFLRDAATRFF